MVAGQHLDLSCILVVLQALYNVFTQVQLVFEMRTSAAVEAILVDTRNFSKPSSRLDSNTFYALTLDSHTLNMAYRLIKTQGENDSFSISALQR